MGRSPHLVVLVNVLAHLRAPVLAGLIRAHLPRLVALATAAALVCATQSAEGAPKKKKKKKPSAPVVEIDTTPTTPTTPTPPPSPPPAPESAPTPEPAPNAHAAPEPHGASVDLDAPASSHGPHAHASPLALIGAKHTLAFDDLSGFRASTAGGIGYAGPLGFSLQSFSQNVLAANGSVAGTDTIHSTTFWFAPSADYFLIDHLSIGGLIEIAYTSANFTQAVFGTTTYRPLPATTNVTILPRAGWMFALGEHWGIWPRLGLGWGLLQLNAITNAGAGNPTSPSSSSTFLLDADVGVLYRMDPRWFMRAAPEFTFGPGAGLVSFSLSAGFGYMWSL